jgi:hypothetical protein
VPTKRIVILANSVKHGEHCVAGKEVFSQGSKLSYGGWIRPVSRDGNEGALTSAQCALNIGRQPKIWDVVDIPVLQPEGYNPQPENWIVDEDEEWERVELHSEVSVPYDQPVNLWLDETQKNDRVHPDNLVKIGQRASLYLIMPETLELRFGWTDYPGYPKKHRRRAVFTHGGVAYDFGLTDPAIEAKYCPVFPNQDEPTKQIQIAKPKDSAICVSLTRPFTGTNCHHKLVATVIE